MKFNMQLFNSHDLPTMHWCASTEVLKTDCHRGIMLAWVIVVYVCIVCIYSLTWFYRRVSYFKSRNIASQTSKITWKDFNRYYTEETIGTSEWMKTLCKCQLWTHQSLWCPDDGNKPQKEHLLHMCTGVLWVDRGNFKTEVLSKKPLHLLEIDRQAKNKTKS